MDFVNAAVDKTLETLDNVAFMVKVTDKSKDGPSRQQVYQLVRLCVSTQLVHLMRTTPPTFNDLVLDRGRLTCRVRQLDGVSAEAFGRYR